MSLLDAAREDYEKKSAEAEERRITKESDYIRRCLRYVSNRLPVVELTPESTEYSVSKVVVRRHNDWEVTYDAIYLTHDGVEFRVYYEPSGYSNSESGVLEVKAGDGSWATVYGLSSIHEALMRRPPNKIKSFLDSRPRRWFR